MPFYFILLSLSTITGIYKTPHASAHYTLHISKEFKESVDTNDHITMLNILMNLNQYSDEACYYVARHGSPEMFYKLLEYNPHIAHFRILCDQPWVGYPIAAYVIDSGSLKKLQYLLKYNIDMNSPVGIGINYPVTITGKTRSYATRNIPLLHYAISTHASLEIIKMIINSGADISRFAPLPCYDYKLWTPLMIAAFFGDVELVRILLAAGAQTEITDSYGATALDYAQLQQHDHIIALLRRS